MNRTGGHQPPSNRPDVPAALRHLDEAFAALLAAWALLGDPRPTTPQNGIDEALAGDPQYQEAKATLASVLAHIRADDHLAVEAATNHLVTAAARTGWSLAWACGARAGR